MTNTTTLWNGEYFQNITQGTTFGAAGYLIPLILIGISIVIITRNTRHMKLLIVPVTIGFTKVGMDLGLGIIIIILGAIVTAVTIMGTSIGQQLFSRDDTITKKAGREIRTTIKGMIKRYAERNKNKEQTKNYTLLNEEVLKKQGDIPREIGEQEYVPDYTGWNVTKEETDWDKFKKGEDVKLRLKFK